MAQLFACIAGEEIHRQLRAGRLKARPLGSRWTPFGPSGEIFRTVGGDPEMLLLARHGLEMGKTAPFRVNARANLYALRDLGVTCVLSWGPAGAVTHNIRVGDMVVLGDVLDRTCLRERTFFPDSPLGYLRQFPVVCPRLAPAIADALSAEGLRAHRAGVAAVCEGPRMETPAEVGLLASAGAQVVTHCFVPELFLARELAMCYAAICYVVNYAETGSRHRPFMGGGLFADLPGRSPSRRLLTAARAIRPLTLRVARQLQEDDDCECRHAMDANIQRYGLSRDWRTWFQPGGQFQSATGEDRPAEAVTRQG